MRPRSLNPASAHGRQAEARRNDIAVLDAARDVFSARGADAPIAAVADRAGVGMGTLYRRYGSKTELLQRLCLLAMEQTLAAANAALAVADPWTGLTAYIGDCVELRTGALAALAGHVDVTAQMQATAERGIAAVAELVDRAHRDRSLRDDVTALDISLLIEMFSRLALELPDPAEERNVRDRLVAIAVAGLRTDAAATALPGRPPSRERYVGRWQRR
jgi:AcrR family transcriptional regulator